jgi:hypothetical protein
MANEFDRFDVADNAFNRFDAPTTKKAPPITRLERIGQGMRDPIDAAAQLLTNVLPEGVVSVGNRLNNMLAQRTGLLGELPAGGINEQISQREAEYQAGREAAGDSGLDAYRLGGNIGSPMNLAIASRIPAGATMLQKLAYGAGAGAGISPLTQPVVGAEQPETDYSGEKVKQAAIGAALGPLAPAVTGAASRVISPKASVNPNVQMLRKAGVTPTMGQTLGGNIGKAEEKLMSLPLVGDLIGSARGRANTQFERAAYNRVLEPIGGKLPMGLKGRDALNFTEGTLKNNYNRVLDSIGAIAPDEQFGSRVSELTNMVNKAAIPQASKDKFTFLLDKVNSGLDENGVMTSEAYKALESSLAADVRKLTSSQDIYDDTVAQAGKQLVTNLTDMLERQSGPLAKELKDTNKAWANFKRVQRAASSVGAQEGQFTPSQLQSAVKASDKTKDKAAFARGDALLQDLSEAGKTVLGNTVPNSGTAERLLLGGGAIGAMFEPTVGLPLLGGASLYTQPVQSGINALLTNRPQSAAPFAELLRSRQQYLIPGISAAGFGLLNQ